jgi:hypothetical protein
LEWQQPVAFDPLAGLSFPTTEDDDLHVGVRLDETAWGKEQSNE